MPYKFKGSRKCTNASGKSGTYVTTKKSGKTTCWKSKAAFERSTAARHAKGMSEQDEEENTLTLTEHQLRNLIKKIIYSSLNSII